MLQDYMDFTQIYVNHHHGIWGLRLLMVRCTTMTSVEVILTSSGNLNLFSRCKEMIKGAIPTTALTN